jgi:hypothetical protein
MIKLTTILAEMRLNDPKSWSTYGFIEIDEIDITLTSKLDDNQYYGQLSDDNKVIFTTHPPQEDELYDLGDNEAIWNEYAPEIFKEIRKISNSWGADDEYIDVFIDFDKLKELFPIKR